MIQIAGSKWIVFATCCGGLTAACTLQDLGHLNRGSIAAAGKKNAGRGGAIATAIGGAANVGGDGGAADGGDPSGDGGVTSSAGHAGVDYTGGTGSDGSAGASLVGSAGSAPSQAGESGIGGSNGGSSNTAAAGAASVAVNLWPDPGFESGVIAWSAFGMAKTEQSTENCYAGSYCLRNYKRTQSWEGPASNILSVVKVGTVYAVSVWARVSGTAMQTLTLTSKTRCEGVSDNASVYLPIMAKGVTSTWQQLAGSLKVVMPETCKTTIVELSVYVEGAAADTDIFLDEVSLTQLL